MLFSKTDNAALIMTFGVRVTILNPNGFSRSITAIFDNQNDDKEVFSEYEHKNLKPRLTTTDKDAELIETDSELLIHGRRYRVFSRVQHPEKGNHVSFELKHKLDV